MIVNFSDYQSCEPLYINVFGKQYRVRQETEGMLDHMATTRDRAKEEVEKGLQEIKQEKLSLETENEDEKKALDTINSTVSAMDNVIFSIKTQIEQYEIAIICYLGEDAWKEIQFKYQELLGEKVSLQFTQKLSEVVTAMANTGKPPKEDAEEQDNFQE